MTSRAFALEFQTLPAASLGGEKSIFTLSLVFLGYFRGVKPRLTFVCEPPPRFRRLWSRSGKTGSLTGRAISRSAAPLVQNKKKKPYKGRFLPIKLWFYLIGVLSRSYSVYRAHKALFFSLKTGKKITCVLGKMGAERRICHGV